MSNGTRSPARKLGLAVATLLLPIFSIGVVALLFEGVLRLMGHQAIYDIYSKPSMFWEHDDDLGWRHQPRAEGRYVGPRPWPIEFESEVSINDAGLRGPEIPEPRTGEPRVVFLGDSMVAGFEVAYDETFVARLGALLSERLGAPVRSINAGMRGYGTDQAYLLFRAMEDVLRPDLVVFFHSGNDPVDNLTAHEMRRPFGKPALRPGADGGLDVIGAPVPRYPMCSEFQLRESYEIERVDTRVSRASCRVQMMLFDHSALFSYLTLAVPWDLELLRTLYYLGNPHAEHLDRAGEKSGGQSFASRHTMKILRALAREVEAAGSEFLVIGFPSHLEQLDVDGLAAAGIDIAPLAAVVERPRDEVRWKRDSHFNPLGHEIVAGELLDPIAAKLSHAIAP